MPGNLHTYTKCAPPGEARSHRQIGGIAGFVANAVLDQLVLTVIGLVALLIGLILLSSPLAWAAVGAAVLIGLSEFKNWYYTGRLLCIADRDCAIGTLISSPEAAFDGDRRLNLLLAPYTQGECVEALLDHLSANEAMLRDDANFAQPPFFGTAPPLPSPAERESSLPVLRDYMKALSGGDFDEGSSNMFRQVMVGLAARLMRDPAKRFYNRYYRKDSAHIAPGTDLWDAIPEDFDPDIDWLGPNAQSGRTHFEPYIGRSQTLNPMFRFDGSHVVPFLHCEIEGYFIKLLIDDAILAVSMWLAMLFFLGPLGALIPAALVLLLKWLLDYFSGNDGDADLPEVEWDEPGVADDDVTSARGDVIVTYGNWIMDTEHHNYFEIHPVRAYYVIAGGDPGATALVGGHAEAERFPPFDVTEFSAERALEICRIINTSEESEAEEEIVRGAEEGLAVGLTTYYGGARVAKDG